MCFSGYLYWETVWIEGLINMLFQIGNRHCWGGVTEFVENTDEQAFLKMELLAFGVEFKTAQVDRCPFMF